MKVYRVWVSKGTGSKYEDFKGEYAEAKAKQNCQDWKNSGFNSWIDTYEDMQGALVQLDNILNERGEKL